MAATGVIQQRDFGESRGRIHARPVVDPGLLSLFDRRGDDERFGDTRPPELALLLCHCGKRGRRHDRAIAMAARRRSAPERRRSGSNASCRSGDGLEAAGGGDHRRGPLVDGFDDPGVVDPAQIRGGDPEMGMPELALDDEQWDTLAGHFDRVRMPQLVVVPTSAQTSICRPDR